jgi:signal transduction histidine kinase
VRKAQKKVTEDVKRLKIKREFLKLPYLVLSVSMLVTVGATYLFYKSAEAKDIARFQSETKEIRNRVENKISAYLTMIKATRGFVESTDKLNQQKFAEFVNSLELVKNYSGVQGIGFSKRVLPEERPEFEKKMQSESDSSFKVFPDSERLEYHAIMYLEPLDERNRRAIGFDMSTDAKRCAAMERARDTGESAATGKVALLQETDVDKQDGFLIYLPIYKSGEMPVSIEDRRRLLEGFVYSPFRAGNFLRDVQNSTSISDIAVTIYENEPQPENVLAQTDNNVVAEINEFKTISDLDVAGQKWVIEFESLPAFAVQSSTGWTPLIFMSGLVFSLLLFGMTYLETYARAKAENITSELQESEREKGFLLEREQNERRRAEEASRAKDDFISIVSHELRTPLNSIAGWSKILHADNLSPLTKKQALEKIDKNLRQQTEIVEELLDFSQILSVKNDVSFRETDFSKVFESAFAEVCALAEEKGVSLNKENTLNGQKILGNRKRLHRVVRNLLSNAIKFTPKGGQVSAEVKEKDGIIEVTVNDTGQGIKREFLPHIFERFRQADTSTTRQHGGLGLGLAMSYHIVKLHGGSIYAASEGEGRGSIFTVKLPQAEEHSSIKKKHVSSG